MPAHVLVTRPLHQSAALISALESLGHTVTAVPCLAIAPPADRKAFLRDLTTALGHAELAIFISRNAVDGVLAGLKHLNRSYPASLGNFAVGAATQAALTTAGIKAVKSASASSSEALLALPALQDVAGKTAVIFRGQTGRTLLVNTLAQRGAQMYELETYRRQRPQSGSSEIEAFLESSRLPGVLTATSVAVMENLINLTPSGVRAALFSLPLVVISGRIAELARKRGFQRVTVSEGMSAQAISRAVSQVISQAD